MTCVQRERQDFSAFKALIANPGNLATGFKLPARAELYISSSTLLAAATVLITANSRNLGAPAGLPANQKHHVGALDRGVRVAKAVTAPANVSVYIRDGMGYLFKIGG